MKETPQPNYAVPVPAEISGRVLLRQPGISAGAEGVSVTDGYSVAKTNAQGEYTLIPHAQAVFIFVTRPAQFDVEGDWYKPLAAVVDFAIRQKQDTLRILGTDFRRPPVFDRITENLRTCFRWNSSRG